MLLSFSWESTILLCCGNEKNKGENIIRINHFVVYYCCCSCCCCVVSISIEMCNYYLFNDWSLLLLSPWKNKNNFFIFNFKYKVLIFEYLWLRMFRHKGSQKSLEHGALYRNPLIRVQSFTFVPLAASIIKKNLLGESNPWCAHYSDTVN